MLDEKANPGDTTCDWIIHEQRRTCPLKAQWVEPITQRCYYIRLCKQIGVSGNMGAQLDYETGELTMWPNELQGKGLAVTFALPGVKPANS